MNKIRSKPIMLIILLVVCAVAVYAYVKLPQTNVIRCTGTLAGSRTGTVPSLRPYPRADSFDNDIRLGGCDACLDPKRRNYERFKRSIFCSCKPLWVSWR